MQIIETTDAEQPKLGEIQIAEMKQMKQAIELIEHEEEKEVAILMVYETIVEETGVTIVAAKMFYDLL